MREDQFQGLQFLYRGKLENASPYIVSMQARKCFLIPQRGKLKGVSSGNSQVSTPFYSTKAESSSPYGKTATEDEEEVIPVSPSFSYFQTTIETLIFESQLRVLNVLNESFEIDMVSLYNEFMLAKNRDKRKYYQSSLI